MRSLPFHTSRLRRTWGKFHGVPLGREGRRMAAVPPHPPPSHAQNPRPALPLRYPILPQHLHLMNLCPPFEASPPGANSLIPPPLSADICKRSCIGVVGAIKYCLCPCKAQLQFGELLIRSLTSSSIRKCSKWTPFQYCSLEITAIGRIRTNMLVSC